MQEIFLRTVPEEEANISTSVLNKKLCIQSDPAPLFIQTIKIYVIQFSFKREKKKKHFSCVRTHFIALIFLALRLFVYFDNVYTMRRMIFFTKIINLNMRKKSLERDLLDFRKTLFDKQSTQSKWQLLTVEKKLKNNWVNLKTEQPLNSILWKTANNKRNMLYDLRYIIIILSFDY